MESVFLSYYLPLDSSCKLFGQTIIIMNPWFVLADGEVPRRRVLRAAGAGVGRLESPLAYRPRLEGLAPEEPGAPGRLTAKS